MKENTKTTVQGSFPVLGVLGLIFITLKLCKVIAWSWWWVLAPFWGPAVLVIAFMLVAGMVAFIVWLVSRRKQRIR